MMALIVPSPAYAAKEPPPPPPPPSNDTGGKVKGPSHSAKDVPNDTTVVVTNNGTPVSLAAQLATDIFSSATPPPQQPVKFCVGSSCTFYDDVEKAITGIKAAPNATGILYVASNYSLSGNGSHSGVLTFDPTSSGWVDPTMNFVMQGGVNIVTNDLLGTSLLKQPLTINGIGVNDGPTDDSSFTLDHFIFNISGFSSSDAISVTSSNNVTLSNLDVTNKASKILQAGNGIGVYGSDDIFLNNVIVNRIGGVSGDGIHIEDSGNPVGYTGPDPTLTHSITLENVTVTNTNSPFGNGINITDSHDIYMNNVSATSSKVYGAHLKDNSDGLSITDSTFSNSGYAGLYVTGQNGEVDLTNVTADNNGKNVLDIAITPFKFLFPDLASGAAFMDNSGALVINESQFNNNATAGLWVQNQSGSAPVGDALAELDGNTGFVMLDNVTANGNGVSPCTTCFPVAGDIFDYMGWTGGSFIDSDAGSVVVKDSNFSGNTGNGLQTYATDGNLIVKNVTADKNTGEGAILNTFFVLLRWMEQFWLYLLLTVLCRRPVSISCLPAKLAYLIL
jgi:hypothetical protein